MKYSVMIMKYNKLSNFFEELLSFHGAIIERHMDDSLDALLPPEISKKLNLPEFSRLIFKSDKLSENDIYSSYDSDLFHALPLLLGNANKFVITQYDHVLPDDKKITKNIPENLDLNNASFRFKKHEKRFMSYLLIYFYYTALSDEKHEGIIPVLINEVNLSSQIYNNYIPELKELKMENTASIDRYDIKKVINSACKSADTHINKILEDFRKSLKRRLNRDIRRVIEYYDTLVKQADYSARKKATYVREFTNEEADNLSTKIHAIESEKKLKIHDLITKFTLHIKVEPLTIIRIQTYTPVYNLILNRRLRTRKLMLSYNPILKRIDNLPCESCFNPYGGYYMCDEKLHILCSKCYKKCPNCNKHFCSVCYKKCPKC